MLYCGMCQKEWSEMKLKRERGETEWKRRNAHPFSHGNWRCGLCPGFTCQQQKDLWFPRFHLTKSHIFSVLCFVLVWVDFFFTFMFLFIKTCTNLTSFKMTQNTQPGHTQRSRHSARSLFGRWSTETSVRAQEGMRQGRGTNSRERVNKQMRNRLNPARSSGNECRIYPSGDGAGLLILQSHQSLVKGCSFRVVTPWSS